MPYNKRNGSGRLVPDIQTRKKLIQHLQHHTTTLCTHEYGCVRTIADDMGRSTQATYALMKRMGVRPPQKEVAA